MSSVTKQCSRCKEVKDLSEFYIRSGGNPLSRVPGHFNSECKTCMADRSRNQPPLLPDQESRVFSENLVIKVLKSRNIWAQPGKMVGASAVDVVMWGCVWAEIKYSRLNAEGDFSFGCTPRQQQRGFLAHIVILICEWAEGEFTYHLFRASDDVFYKNPHNSLERHVKSAWTYRPERIRSLRTNRNSIAMSDDMMGAARDNWQLIEDVRLEISASLSGKTETEHGVLP